MISPELTNKREWTEGTVIEVEENSFVGTVISAETETREIFFGKAAMFKETKEEICLH